MAIAAACTSSSLSSYYRRKSSSMNHSANDAEDKNNSNMTATTNTTENNPRRRHNQPLSRSLILAPKVSLIDNTLAHGYSLKRARGEIILNKSKSDSMIHTTKRMKLQSSYDDNNTTVIISSTNLSASISCSLSSSSAFAKVDPEGNLCPYSFIDSLYRTSSESESSSSSPPRPPLLSKRTTQPLEDTDFHPPTPEQIEAYSNDAVSAVRSSDVDSLRELLSNGHSLQCCNRFGESLLHVACRRSNAKIVAFLLHEANVSPCIRDDYGRTPMHDACWRGNPEYEIVELLLTAEPRLAFVKDVRGYKPFQYARREHWGAWREFIDRNRELILLP